MPIFYVIAFLFLFAKFWLDKYLVLYMQRKPTSFDGEISASQIKYFKIPIFFHLIFAVINYSNNFVFYDSEVNLTQFGLSEGFIDKIPMDVSSIVN